jgi:hypothetical protein
MVLIEFCELSGFSLTRWEASQSEFSRLVLSRIQQWLAVVAKAAGMCQHYSE